ncbi:MAG: hypothetical protein U0271_15580 [Polyangiaceae bacterium]
MAKILRFRSALPTAEEIADAVAAETNKAVSFSLRRGSSGNVGILLQCASLGEVTISIDAPGNRIIVETARSPVLLERLVIGFLERRGGVDPHGRR